MSRYAGKRILVRFEQVTDDEYNGQGLAIAHSVVVDKHGGTLTFDSTVGKGTVFTIRLPIDRRPNAAIEGA